MVQLKEAKIQERKPFVMELKEFVINFGPSNKRILNKYDESKLKKIWCWNKPYFIH